MYNIFVVSDGTGRTAEQTLNAALVQFPDVPVAIHIRPNIRSESQIVEVVDEARAARAFIIHTLVEHKLREFIIQTGRLHNVETIDLMGPLLSRLTLFLSPSPTQQPGLFYRLNREYFMRIDCMQFAFWHDDGQRPDELEKAEIILVGVSRTFKTPLSIFLAFKGWFVANVPIVLGIEPPEILSELPHGRVIGLTTFPSNLSTLRKARQEYLDGMAGEYADLDYVSQELNYAKKIFDAHHWPVINVTNKPIEEISTELLAILVKLAPPDLFHGKT